MTQTAAVLSQEENERLDRIYIRVKAGAGLKAALERENCKDWFYGLDKKHRARINAQALENQQRRLQTKDASFVYNLTPDQKKVFAEVCQRKGETVSSRIAQLINTDIASQSAQAASGVIS